MNFRNILLFAVVGLLLVSSLDAAKAAKKGSGKKGVKEAKVDKKALKNEKPVKAEKTKVKAEKVPEPVEAVEEEPIEEPVVEAKPAKVKAPKAPKEEVAAAPAEPKIVRPKNLKVFSAYDKCKQECAKIRDSQDISAYVAQLKDELAAAEASLAAAADAHADEPAQPVEIAPHHA